MSWRRFRKRAWWDAERVREIECHIEIEIDENIARGLPPAQAVAAAYRKFGNPALIREDIHRMNTVSWFEEPLADLRHAFRLLRLNPGFFAVAALSLILGIGANAAIFQLLDVVRLRMLPVRQPEQLARIKIAENPHCCSGHFSGRVQDLTSAQWQQIQKLQQAFAGIFAWSSARFNLTERGEARFADGVWVSGEFFNTLGLKPMLGRLITAQDDHPGCGLSEAVISYGFWQREFGGDPQVIGKSLLLEGHRLSVVGVTPASFFGLEVGRNFDVALPLCAEAVMAGEHTHMDKRSDWWLGANGRLKPGWTLARAGAQLQSISRAVFESSMPPHLSPDDEKYWRDYKLTAEPAGSGVSTLRREYDEPLTFLLAIAGLVLVIACANLANLMLARASVREREMAIRLAIGAGKARLVRQMFAESVLLAALGVGGGIVAAQFLSRYLASFLSTEGDRIFLDLHPDWTVLAFTAAVGLLTCLIFGLYPALKSAQITPIAAMRNSGRSLTAGREKFGFRRLLVISQVSLSLVLLVSAILFVRSLHKLMTLDAGFRESGILIANVDLSQAKIPVERRSAQYRDLLESVRRIPGVEEASTARVVPVGGDFWNEYVQVMGRSKPEQAIPWFNSVSRGFFRTMGSRLIAGRDFDQHDTPGSPNVAIVNEKFAKQILGGASPLGKQFKIVVGPGEPEHLYEIVGVVENTKYVNLREDFGAQVYLAWSQEKDPGLGVTILVRSNAALGALIPSLQRTIMSVNPSAAFQFQSFQTQVRNSLLRERLMATLSGLFGMLAAVLASVGLYGVISYMAARRRNEIGIRIALGASESSILCLVFREAGSLLGVGLLIGTLLAIGAAQIAKSLLYGLQPADPGTIGSAVALLGGVALAATLIPALKAARLNPMAALREE
jgi:putative ABC transport system permease protein